MWINQGSAPVRALYVLNSMKAYGLLARRFRLTNATKASTMDKRSTLPNMEHCRQDPSSGLFVRGGSHDFVIRKRAWLGHCPFTTVNKGLLFPLTYPVCLGIPGFGWTGHTLYLGVLVRAFCGRERSALSQLPLHNPVQPSASHGSRRLWVGLLAALEVRR
jgi:hypothetical protein